MTEQELKKIETKLEKRGYKKYTTCLTSNESWAWFKSFEKESIADEESVRGYQLAFRVWDFSKYSQIPINDSYSIDIWASPFNTHCRMDFECNWEPFCDIDTFEEMAKKFYSFTRIFTKRYNKL